MGVVARKLQGMELRRFAELSTEERESFVDELSRKATAPRNGQAANIDARILAFENQYGITSDEMRRRFKSGEMRDTGDVSRWLMLLRVRER